MNNVICPVCEPDIKDFKYETGLLLDNHFHMKLAWNVIHMLVAVIVMAFVLMGNYQKSDNDVHDALRIVLFSEAKAEEKVADESVIKNNSIQITVLEQVLGEYSKAKEDEAIEKENKKTNGEMIDCDEYTKPIDSSLLKDVVFEEYDDIEFEEQMYSVYSAPYEDSFHFTNEKMKYNHYIQVAGCENDEWVLVRYKANKKEDEDFYRVGYVKGLKRKNNEKFPKLDWCHYYGHIKDTGDTDWFTDGRTNRNLAINNGEFKNAAILGIIESEKYGVADEHYNGAYYVEIIHDTKIARGIVPQNAVDLIYYHEKDNTIEE